MIDVISLILLSLIVIIAAIIMGVVIKNSKKNIEPAPIIKNISRLMTFDECNDVIEHVITDIYNNKYLLYYRLKQITVIPDLENEITTMTKEILDSFSENQMDNINLYYSEEYFIQMVTRRCQVLLIDYTNNYKPKVS